MAHIQTGLSITIKAFIHLKPRDLNHQLEMLTLAKQAHETGEYAALIAAAQITEVKVEQKSRKVEEVAAPTPATEPVPAAEPAPLLDIMEAAPVAGISSGDNREDPADFDNGGDYDEVNFDGGDEADARVAAE